jgi:hypothetical protein
MRKLPKNKKDKIKKISEEEYLQYLSSLKETGQVCVENHTTPKIKQTESLKS